MTESRTLFVEVGEVDIVSGYLNELKCKHRILKPEKDFILGENFRVIQTEPIDDSVYLGILRNLRKHIDVKIVAFIG